MITLAGALAICSQVWSQSTVNTSYFTIEQIEKGEDYAFPLVKSKAHPAVANKINQVLQLEMIGKSYNLVGKKLFDNLMEKDSYFGTTSMWYTILVNNAALLSIEFEFATMAAYPDNHTRYFNFNSATGDLINIHELFTESGIEHLNDLASEYFNESIRHGNSDLFDSTIARSEREEMLETLFDLTQCNATHTIDQFGVTPQALIIDKGVCLPHAVRASDIDWSHQIKIDDLSGLSPYGEKLLREKRSDYSFHFNEKKHESGMALYGSINANDPFCMYLRLYSDNNISGEFWYEKKGILIDVNGKRISRDNIVIEDERIISQDDNGMVTEKLGKFDFTLLENGGITGTWTNHEGKSFPIQFE